VEGLGGNKIRSINKEITGIENRMPKLLVLYVFHEYNSRVEYFLKHCFFEDINTDFVVICNNKTCKFDTPPYVRVILRENIGFDTGGWCEGLFTNDAYNHYDTFLFVNSSVMGPFVPSYYKGKWTDVYVNGLKGNIKLFGSTINCCNQPLTKAHVQTYIFAMNKATLDYLIECEIFTKTVECKSLWECVVQKELGMSRKVIEKGWNIGSLLDLYKGVDFTFTTKKPEDYGEIFNFGKDGDIMFPEYRGTIWNEYELVFIKGNRCGGIVPRLP